MIVVLADDLSGAAELANAARQCGLTAEVQQSFEPSAPSDVCAVNVDSRALDPLAAVHRMADVTRRVAAAQPQWFYKKVDSMLRGHVGLEIEAMLAAMNADRALLVPANPSRGRVIRRARYCIEDRPLHQTTLAADPEFPRTTAEIGELVGTTSLRVQAGVRSPECQGPILFVPDTESQQDIDRHAQQADDFPLIAGALDLFLAVLTRRCGLQAKPGEPPIEPSDAMTSYTARPLITKQDSVRLDLSKPDTLKLNTVKPNSQQIELLVCGSKSAWVDRVASCEARGIPWFSLPSESVTATSREAVLQWVDRISPQIGEERRALIGLGIEAVYDGAARKEALERLAYIAHEIGRRLSVRRWLLEGGATAHALLKTTGRIRFPLGDAMPHGSAQLLADHAASGWHWYVKPGSYPWPMPIWPR